MEKSLLRKDQFIRLKDSINSFDLVQTYWWSKNWEIESSENLEGSICKIQALEVQTEKDFMEEIL
jgi:hypothetical protein